jgi:hypothetical protein
MCWDLPYIYYVKHGYLFASHMCHVSYVQTKCRTLTVKKVKEKCILVLYQYRTIFTI